MLEVKTEIRNINPVVTYLMNLPGEYAKARKSALEAVAGRIRKVMIDFIKTGGEGKWPKLHPLTKKFRKSNDESKYSWLPAKGLFLKGNSKSPLFFFWRFVKYAANADGTKAGVFFDSRGVEKLQFGSVDYRVAMLTAIHEEGLTIPVTRRTRWRWAKTRRLTDKKRPKVGRDYFALRKTTTTIRIPKREITAPVYWKVRGNVPAWFEEKFYEKLNKPAIRQQAA